jgi:hypothetical protein
MSAADEVLLSTVNAPFKRPIPAATLVACLSRGSAGAWPAHVATFFTELDAPAVLAFAERHGVPAARLGEAYAEMKARTGESDPEIERALAA